MEPVEPRERSNDVSNENQRPSALEIIGKVILILVALTVVTAFLGLLVFGACALLMR